MKVGDAVLCTESPSGLCKGCKGIIQQIEENRAPWMAEAAEVNFPEWGTVWTPTKRLQKLSSAEAVKLQTQIAELTFSRKKLGLY